MKILALTLGLQVITITLYAQNTFPASGNVGIGTSSPDAALTVNGIANFYPSRVNGGDARSLWITNRLANARFLDNSAPVVLATGDGNQPLVLDAARVGIGTLDPDARLAVNGLIHTREVKVDMNNWPDYVFNQTYTLRPLSDLQKYIDANHHLPEMPSAAEVESRGANLGEMNKLLLKKVEELTLYILENEKRVEALNTALKELKAELGQKKSR